MNRGDILIVDDNANNLTLLAGILRDAGYHIRVAKSGKRALETVTVSPPELVMLDIQMPEMSGYEVCTALKAEEVTRPIPVIFISALDDVSDKVQGFDVGGVDYVTKPFQAEEVLARVAAHLELFRLRRELEANQRELQERNNALEASQQELRRQYDELLQARKRTELVFSALAEALPGTVLDAKYRLDLKIGEGGFGAVFRATHLTLDRPVAVKVFRPRPGNDTAAALDRFRQEGIAACRVHHPNAVEVLDFGISSKGIAYLVMELLRGYTLGETLRQRGALPLDRCLEIVIPVCEALGEAHAAGIVHRDIKPENIFLHQTKHGEVVKVVDFGIAKLMGEEEVTASSNPTATGSVLGTPDYMAPERIAGDKYDGRADVYSIGVMLYEILVGERPFSATPGANAYATALKHLTETPKPIRDRVPDIPPDIASLVSRAMARLANVRPTAMELAEELKKR